MSSAASTSTYLDNLYQEKFGRKPDAAGKAYWTKQIEKLDIPVFHDDQHGTAIITTAALINALDISKKSIKKIIKEVLGK